MPNHTLALDVGPRTLRAALVERSLRSQRVLGLYAHPRGSGGDLAADLRALAVQHGIAWDEVVSVLPGDAVTHRILELPFADRKRLEQTVPFELESHLPFELDETVIDFQVLDTSADGTSHVLAVSAPKAVVREHLATLAAAGIDPRLVDLGSLAALNVVRDAAASRGGRIAFVGLDAERTTVALLSDGRLTGLRVVSAGVANGDLEHCLRDVRWTLLALADGEALTALWVGGEAMETPGALAALGRALGTTPQPLDGVALPAVPVAFRGKQAAFATPLGLALRQTGDGTPFGVDLRRGEFAYHREREALWRGLARAGVLAVAAVVLMTASFVVDARQLAARRDAVRADIRTIFTGALPGVRTIVNEKAQLQSEIAALEKQRRLFGSLAPSAPKAIDCLRALTAAVPDDVPLNIEELSLDGETLRLRGSTKTYDGVEAVKRGLAARPEFRNVEAKDVRSSVDGQQVDFRLSLDVGAEPQGMSAFTDLLRRLAALIERLSPRERVLLGVGVGAGLLVGVWAFAGFLAERRATLQAQIVASERDVGEMGRLRDRYLQLKAEREVVRRKLDRGGADFSLFSHLEGVTRDTLSRDRVAAMNPSTRTVAEDLQEEDVEMRLSGVSLRELVALLYRVEKTDLPLLVSRIQMKKRFDQPFVYDATLVVGRLRPTTASTTP